MSVWGNYCARIDARGTTWRNAAMQDEKRYITTKIVNNLSYHHVRVDGVDRDLSVINSDNLDEKFIISMPGDDLRLGAIVDYADNHWLITEKETDRTLYTKCKMLQCNHVLKWVDDDDNTIHGQWCVVEDGTKYLTGDYTDRDFVVTRGDARIAITIARNEYTAKLDRDRRFLIDDDLATHKHAYALTKPLRLGHYYDTENGIYKFVLSESYATDDDNQELGVADYYKYFPRDEKQNEEQIVEEQRAEDTRKEDGRKVWL